jgi:tRNA(fMet)-specific endonuclease VapC
VAEFLAGVYMAATESQRAARRAFLERVLSALPIEDYTQHVAEHHGELLAHVRRSGTTRGAHDLIIAATIAATGRTIPTADDGARFGDLPNVAARVIAARAAASDSD